MVFITVAWLQSSILGHVNFKLPPKMVPPMCKLRIMNIMSSTISKKLKFQKNPINIYTMTSICDDSKVSTKVFSRTLNTIIDYSSKNLKF